MSSLAPTLLLRGSVYALYFVGRVVFCMQSFGMYSRVGVWE